MEGTDANLWYIIRSVVLNLNCQCFSAGMFSTQHMHWTDGQTDGDLVKHIMRPPTGGPHNENDIKF